MPMSPLSALRAFDRWIGFHFVAVRCAPAGSVGVEPALGSIAEAIGATGEVMGVASAGAGRSGAPTAGSVGAAVAIGAAGAAGTVGAAGAIGAAGIVGMVGPTGMVEAAGIVGATGIVGSVGPVEGMSVSNQDSLNATVAVGNGLNLKRTVLRRMDAKAMLSPAGNRK